MYEETAVGGARAIWRSVGSRGAAIPADGCVDVILRDDDVWVAGPSTSWIPTLADPEGGSLGLRFSPGTAAAVVRADLAEIADRLVPARELVTRGDAGRVREVLLRARDSWPEAARLVAPLGASTPPASWTLLVCDRARRAAPAAHVGELLGWSPRTFRRRMLASFGYPYTTLVRIERARRAQTALRTGASLVDAAVRAGYADQPHLSREFRRLVGVSPGQFAASSA